MMEGQNGKEGLHMSEFYYIRHLCVTNTKLVFYCLQEISLLIKQQKMELKGGLLTQWKPPTASVLTWTS